MDDHKLSQTSRVESEGEAQWWISLDPGDEVLARAQAERRGLEYQNYVRMVLHRAL
jgi:hypothetical protein